MTDPPKNDFVESSNARLRDERFSAHLFPSLTTVRRIIGAWRTDYNTVRPHRSPRTGTRRLYAPPRHGHMDNALSYQRP
ncbi:integrase core domain-containing protein [Sphingomonas sp. BK481]|uniref:integrase core domain-containing protein n=1 Tax=Sphingomonas sp. BK481 TaxID=2586981 RepID=UPI003908291C